MFLAGDEFGNTQYGNNNSYCQDNEISWLDWTQLEANRDMFEYVRSLIAFRQEHPVLRGATVPAHCGWPDVSLHNLGHSWNDEVRDDTRQIGVLFSGRNADDTADDWCLSRSTRTGSRTNSSFPSRRRESLGADAPHLGAERFCADIPFDGHKFNLDPRSVAVVTAKAN